MGSETAPVNAAGIGIRVRDGSIVDLTEKPADFNVVKTPTTVTVRVQGNAFAQSTAPSYLGPRPNGAIISPES